MPWPPEPKSVSKSYKSSTTMTEQKIVSSPDNENNSSIVSNLTEIYDEMRSRNRAAILKAGSMRSDAYFSQDPGRTDDDRRCLAISAVIDETVNTSFSNSYQDLKETLRREFPNDLHFDQCTSPDCHGQLHWTAMQLVGFADYDEECGGASCPYFQQEYLDCIQDSLHLGGLDREFTITYVGVIAVATGLLMIGIPSINLNAARDALRDKLMEKKLPLKEPFVNNIVHSTLFRVTTESSIDQHLRLLEIAKQYENVVLGQVTVQSLQVGPASWRMQSSEIIDTPPLRKWVLPVQNPTQEYCSSISESRSVFTVSGASGVNLRKEIELALHRDSSNSSPTLVAEPLLVEKEADYRPSSPSKDNVFDHFPVKKLDHPQGKEVHGDHPNNMAANACTISGAGGSMLAQELQQMLRSEQMLLDSFYSRDFY